MLCFTVFQSISIRYVYMQYVSGKKISFYLSKGWLSFLVLSQEFTDQYLPHQNVNERKKLTLVITFCFEITLQINCYWGEIRLLDSKVLHIYSRVTTFTLFVEGIVFFFWGGAVFYRWAIQTNIYFFFQWKPPIQIRVFIHNRTFHLNRHVLCLKALG